MKVSKQKYIEPHRQNTTIFQVNTAYTDLDKPEMYQCYSELIASDTFGKIYERISSDNGKTWTEPKLVFEPYKTLKGIVRIGESTFFFNRKNQSLVIFYNRNLYEGDYLSPSVRTSNGIFYKLSTDGGKTFLERPIVHKGYHAENWAKDTVCGKSSLSISFCAPIEISNGNIILPVMGIPPDADIRELYLLPCFAGCLIGSWASDQLEWEMSEKVLISPDLSSRGLCEPAIAELENGSLLMVARGGNASMPDKPGYKWISLSCDGGLTWSKPGPFLDNSGQNFFSPTSGSSLIRSSLNKKLYWLGNITPENPKGNSPRYPLIIAEVDEKKTAIIKESIAIIENKQETDSPLVQFSNFKVYEDRETKEFVLTMARIMEKGHEDRTEPAYRYQINVEKPG